VHASVLFHEADGAGTDFSVVAKRPWELQLARARVSGHSAGGERLTYINGYGDWCGSAEHVSPRLKAPPSSENLDASRLGRSFARKKKILLPTSCFCQLTPRIARQGFVYHGTR